MAMREKLRDEGGDKRGERQRERGMKKEQSGLASSKRVERGGRGW